MWILLWRCPLWGVHSLGGGCDRKDGLAETTGSFPRTGHHRRHPQGVEMGQKRIWKGSSGCL